MMKSGYYSGKITKIWFSQLNFTVNNDLAGPQPFSCFPPYGKPWWFPRVPHTEGGPL